MAKAFVDTTVLTDALLKTGEPSARARAALQRYELTEVPVYAIKEFKAGPLKNFTWFHNKLVITRSFAKAVGALQRMALTPRRYTTATALEALRDGAILTGGGTMEQLLRKYGPNASQDEILADRFRLSIKTAIFRAWRRRRSIVSRVVCPLPCYLELDLVEVGGQIVLDPTSCDKDFECEIARQFKTNTEALVKLKAAVDAAPTKGENKRRAQALRHLIRTPKRDLPENLCRSLGDAVFAFLAPQDSKILTTNLRDMEPLAKALGKNVDAP